MHSIAWKTEEQHAQAPIGGILRETYGLGRVWQKVHMNKNQLSPSGSTLLLFVQLEVALHIGGIYPDSTHPLSRGKNMHSLPSSL